MISLEQAEELIQRSRPRSLWVSPQTLLLLLCGGVLGAMLARPEALARGAAAQFLLTQTLLAVALLWLWLRTRRRQQVDAGVRSLWEAVQFKDWPRAESLVTSLLRRPVPPTTIRAQSLMVLAAVADNQKQYPVAQHVLESILREYGDDRGLSWAVRPALAGTLLRTQQLTDAVAMIEKLGREDLPDAVRAQVELVNLFRFLVMGQTDDAIVRADERRALFRRHLGTRAGYGYALLAMAFDRSGQHDRAAELWRDATMLIAPTDLVDRFSELRTVASRYPAAEWPL